jgi:hypothetical protein
MVIEQRRVLHGALLLTLVVGLIVRIVWQRSGVGVPSLFVGLIERLFAVF